MKLLQEYQQKFQKEFDPLMLRLSKKLHLDVKKTSILVLGLFACAVIFVYFYIFKDLPNPAGLKNYKVIPLSTEILDRNGKLLYDVYKEENRTPINIKDV